MTVKIGAITTMVISYPKIAKEALYKNDQAVSNRYVSESLQALSHDKYSLIFMPISPKWKTLRKFCATTIFSAKKFDSTQSLRLEKLKELVVYLQENCRKGKSIDIGEAAFITSLNSLSNTLFSIDLASFTSGSSHKFRDIVSTILIEISKPNIADYYPILRRIDPQRARRRMKNYFQKLLTHFESIIEDRSNQKKDFVMEGSDVLDSFLNNPELTSHEVLHLFLVRIEFN
jgi:cytochrome P450